MEWVGAARGFGRQDCEEQHRIVALHSGLGSSKASRITGEAMEKVKSTRYKGSFSGIDSRGRLDTQVQGCSLRIGMRK